MRPFIIFASAVTAAAAGVAAEIQPGAQRETSRQTAPISPVESRVQMPSETGAAPEAPQVLGTGSEFGEQAILRRRAHVEPWSASVEALGAFTNNAALTPSGEVQDWYLRTGVSAGYTNRIKGRFFLDLGLHHSLYRYAEFDTLDFDHTRFEAGLLYQVPWLDDAFLFTRATYQRIAEPFGSKLFDSYALSLGVQKVWKIRRGQQLFAGLSADVALSSDPPASERDEYSLVLGYTARLTTKLSAQLSYRPGWYRYREGGRADWNQLAALGLTYDLTDRARLSTTASFSRNTSNRAFAEYNNLVAGLGLNLHLEF